MLISISWLPSRNIIELHLYNENWKQNKTEDGRQVLDHSDTDESTMLLILEYMYVGSTSEICGDKVAKVYLAADFLHLDHLLDVCEEKLDQRNALDLFQVCFTLERFSSAQICLEALKGGFIGLQSNMLSMLSIQMACHIVTTFKNIFSDIDLYNFIEKYGKSFSSDNKLDEDSIDKIIEGLQVLTQVKLFFFRFTQEQHSAISSSLQNATQNPSSKTKIISLLKHHLSKKRSAESTTVSPSEIFPDEARFSYVTTKLSAMLNQSENNQNKIKWDLLFRASEHGYKSKVFHEHCDEKGPTVTFIKANDRLVAAYNCDAWFKDSETSNVKGFIVSIDFDKDTFTVFYRDSDSQAVGALGYLYDGPAFGNPVKYDLVIADCCGSNKHSVSMLGSSYIGASAADITPFGVTIFTVQEYEVFGMEFLSF